MCRSLSLAIALILTACIVSADEKPSFLNVWPGKAPGETKESGKEGFREPTGKERASVQRLENVSVPTLTLFEASRDKKNGCAVIVAPGGGFSILAWDLEGTEVAEWLNSLGFAAAVVKYRVPTGGHGDALDDKGTMPLKAPGPVMDAQRAISLTRAHAAEWGLDTKRIGIMGFSAGGATAGITALQRGARAYDKVDASDEESCAADFALLIYPAYMADKATGNLNTF